MKRTLIVLLIASLMLSGAFLMPNSEADTYENMPGVPAEQVEYVCPNATYTAHTLQFNDYDGEMIAIADWFMNEPFPGTESFTGIRYQTPYPNSTGITVLEDKLWINELVSINLFDLVGAPFPDQNIAPLVVLDTATMSHNDSELWGYLKIGLTEWMLNGTIVDKTWYPSYLLDFRIYNSAYIDLELLGSPKDVTVMGFFVTNCSRETYWQYEESFLYAYYTTQKKYEVTLQVENNISISKYYDVNWYVGFPANRVIDPQTLRVYDNDNDVYLTLGEHFDASNAGVWMHFPTIGVGKARSFTFIIYSWNATIGLGVAIAYTDQYSTGNIGEKGYFKATPTWTNTYGRVYQGQVNINLDLEGGVQRDILPSEVEIYDQKEGRWLEPWEFVVSGGLIIIDYAVVNVGSAIIYDVYFQLDLGKADPWSIYDTVGGVPIWGWLTILTGVGIIALVVSDGKRTKGGRKLRLNSTAVAFALVMASMLFILWYFYQAGVL